MTIIKTIQTTEPEQAALKFSAILSADKGVPNDVRPVDGGYVVEADDGRAIFFTTGN